MTDTAAAERQRADKETICPIFKSSSPFKTSGKDQAKSGKNGNHHQRADSSK
ncbi:hypothetical protein [Photorhabdus laumondii]|uniref:hypothetical protein n=1 Tax=Photorhabdus laumondii TaxID=2218628 RepID=UPI0033154BBD